jgi:hypothetical protein
MWHVREEVHKGFMRKNLRETDHSEDLGVEGSITSKSMFKKHNGKNVNWINLEQDRTGHKLL